ncbi:DNA-binding response regulator [Paraphotobacterium marinum]|uniref:DNA-binding response regulator n=1 Tax=Paraphotobacterium marinum TaxID=1755811 RepID=A0A220VGC9_9GAMM|nr:two component system response regulator [Paraphotobacterium marinum]ASK79013.1 DNA-binding response regulator [Paraphotobacterium marinum]
MSKTKTLIVDDHIFVAHGIKEFLEKFDFIEVIGVCENGLDVYNWCVKHKPNLVLLDLGLPGMRGLDVITKLKKRWPKLKIICVSATTDESKIKEALDSGASGYVLKISKQYTLHNAIESVLKNQIFIDPEINVSVLKKENENKEQVKLTTRESQVLKLIYEGKKNREIAEHLLISLKTVESHRLNLMRKLDAHNAIDLIKWAKRLGF